MHILRSVFLRKYRNKILQLVIYYDVILLPKKMKFLKVGKSGDSFRLSEKSLSTVKKYRFQTNSFNCDIINDVRDLILTPIWGDDEVNKNI